MQSIRREYEEMPGLSLTFEQACRLWQVDVTTSQRVLDTLVQDHFLARRQNGTFIALPSPPRHEFHVALASRAAGHRRLDRRTA